MTGEGEHYSYQRHSLGLIPSPQGRGPLLSLKFDTDEPLILPLGGKLFVEILDHREGKIQLIGVRKNWPVTLHVSFGGGGMGV